MYMFTHSCVYVQIIGTVGDLSYLLKGVCVSIYGGRELKSGYTFFINFLRFEPCVVERKVDIFFQYHFCCIVIKYGQNIGLIFKNG